MGVRVGASVDARALCDALERVKFRCRRADVLVLRVEEAPQARDGRGEG